MKQTKLIVTLLAILLVHTAPPASAGELSPELLEKIQRTNQEYLSVIVHLADQADLSASTLGITGRNKALRSRQVIKVLKATAIISQEALITFLEKEKLSGAVVRYTSFWIFNGLALRATPEVIQKVALQDGVDVVTEDLPVPPPVLLPSATLQSDSPYTWNIEKIRAQEVWEMGYNGEDVVVGIFDTGVDGNHPDLASKYRGGNNSWFDPHGEYTTPHDSAGEYTGHGTHIAGIILGGDASDKYIGVAPGAKWIAAKAWNDQGESTTSTIHEIFQWFMDPDGDPATDDTPDLVNNSWSLEDKLFDTFPCCKLDFKDDITAWRMAGIIPVFAAGNSGPWFFTGESPGNYPETIAVGATDLLDSIAFFSSRGPSNCDLSIFPDITAPGVAILSSAPDGNYRTFSGTSQAAPHIAGTIALMLDANPNLNIDEIESILRATATPLGFFHPNFTYGWGQLDALEAVSATLP